MINIRNLTKTVSSGDENLTILDDVSIEISDGQFVAITGASGSGKSTMLGLIAGLDAPSTGSIEIDGEDVTAMGEDDLQAAGGVAVDDPASRGGARVALDGHALG